MNRLLSLLICLVIPLGVVSARGDTPSWQGLRPAEPIGGALALTGQHGEPFTLDRLQRPLALLAFGYTHCPDICPETLELMQRVAVRIPEPARPALLFVTVDPQHDTPEVLEEFLSWFELPVIGLTGTEAEVAQVAEAYRVNHRREADGSIAHSAYLYLIDGRGQVLLMYPFGSPAEAVVADIAALYGRAARR